MKKKTLYALVEKISYLGKKSPGVFEAGFVKNAGHKNNTIYLQMPDENSDILFELTDDEALAVASILTYTVWHRSVPMKRQNRRKLRWIQKIQKNIQKNLDTKGKEGISGEN